MVNHRSSLYCETTFHCQHWLYGWWWRSDILHIWDKGMYGVEGENNGALHWQGVKLIQQGVKFSKCFWVQGVGCRVCTSLRLEAAAPLKIVGHCVTRFYRNIELLRRALTEQKRSYYAVLPLFAHFWCSVVTLVYFSSKTIQKIFKKK